MHTPAEGTTTDSIFIQNSRPIKFIVNKINISKQDREWIVDVLIPQLEKLGDRGVVYGRATASPEGPYDNNRRLATQRCASVNALLDSYGISSDRIQYDVVAEDYDLLYTMMMLKHDAKFHDVDSLITLYAGDTKRLKAAMKRHDGGNRCRQPSVHSDSRHRAILFHSGNNAYSDFTSSRGAEREVKRAV